MLIVRHTTAPPTFDARCLDTVFIVDNPKQFWPQFFAVVTACNPVGSTQESEQPRPRINADDEVRNAHLRQVLLAEGFDPFPVTGASPDHSHQEPGYGFSTHDLALACHTARSFDQWGFFWVQHGEVYICTDDSGMGWYIGNWDSRLRQHT